MQYKNKYYSNDTMLKEYVLKVLWKKYMIAGIIIIVVGIFKLLYDVYESNILSIGVISACIIICLITVIVSPIQMYKQLKDYEKRIHNGQKFESEITFDDKIILKEGSFNLTVEYSQITKTYNLKHSFVLMFAKNSGIMVEKNSFTNCTFDEFLDLLKAKNIKV